MRTKNGKNVINVLSLPDSVNAIIQQYLNLNLGGKQIVTPYYINSNYDKPVVCGKVLADIQFNYVKKKTKQRALIGKGSPREIEIATEKSAHKNNFDLNKATKEEIKQFMEENRIGIDCSGLVVWILNELAKKQYGKPVWQYIDFNTNNILKRLMVQLRSVENISVKVLSNPVNVIPIKNILDIHIGDMIIGWYD